MNAIIQFADSQASRLLRFPAHSIAGSAGTSFKHEHLSAILAERPAHGFFEVHAENYIAAGGLAKPNLPRSGSVKASCRAGNAPGLHPNIRSGRKPTWKSKACSARFGNRVRWVRR